MIKSLFSATEENIASVPAYECRCCYSDKKRTNWQPAGICLVGLISLLISLFAGHSLVANVRTMIAIHSTLVEIKQGLANVLAPNSPATRPPFNIIEPGPEIGNPINALPIIVAPLPQQPLVPEHPSIPGATPILTQPILLLPPQNSTVPPVSVVPVIDIATNGVLREFSKAIELRLDHLILLKEECCKDRLCAISCSFINETCPVRKRNVPGIDGYMAVTADRSSDTIDTCYAYKRVVGFDPEPCNIGQGDGTLLSGQVFCLYTFATECTFSLLSLTSSMKNAGETLAVMLNDQSNRMALFSFEMEPLIGAGQLCPGTFFPVCIANLKMTNEYPACANLDTPPPFASK